MPGKLAILGSTGSIGRQCLDVVKSLDGEFEVVSMAAGSNVILAAVQIALHHPKLVSVGHGRGCGTTRSPASREVACHPFLKFLFGPDGIEQVATHPDADTVVSAAVGVVGLRATYKAVLAGKKIALANKEVLVAAGEFVTAAVEQHNVCLLPVDSEHNAIHQCLRAGERKEVKRLVLTASGGPFRKTPLSKMRHVSPKQALAHPNWKMGQRITIDSATMMNKGFEVIEARWLFGMDARPNRGCHSSSVHGALDGRIRGRFNPGTIGPHGYAHAAPICANLSGARLVERMCSQLVEVAQS